MKIEITFEYKKLRKRLKEALEQAEYWKKLQGEQHREHDRWCDDIYSRICVLLHGSFDCLDSAIIALLDKYRELGGGPIKDKYCIAICSNKECRCGLSYYWNYCPRCGSKLERRT